MTIRKNLFGLMVIVMFCLNIVPILPQKRVGKASVRRGTSTTAGKTSGKRVTKKGVIKQVAVTQEQTPQEQVEVENPEVVVQEEVVQQPEAQLIVLPEARVPASEETKKQAWEELQDNIISLQGAQVFFHPTLSPYNGDPLFDDAWTSKDQTATFRFSIAAEGDATFQILGESVRTITIGANNNSNIVVRVGDLSAPVKAVSASSGMKILEGENIYVPFWVSYDKENGELKIGKGAIGTNVLMTWNDPSPLKSSLIKFGFGGLAGSQGSKVFYTNIYPVLPSGVFALALPSTEETQSIQVQKLVKSEKSDDVVSSVKEVTGKAVVASKGRTVSRAKTTNKDTSGIKRTARKTTTKKASGGQKIARKTSTRRTASTDNAS